MQNNEIPATASSLVLALADLLPDRQTTAFAAVAYQTLVATGNSLPAPA